MATLTLLVCVLPAYCAVTVQVPTGTQPLAVFFSVIMTGLFKLRDHVLVWQKGVIKW